MAVNFKVKVSKAIRDAVANVGKRKVLDAIGREGVRIIAKRTQVDGRRVNPDSGRLRNLDKLKPSTVKKRESLQKRGKLSRKTSPSRSNLTESGDMVKSLRYRIGNKTVSIRVNKKSARKIFWLDKLPGFTEFLQLSKGELKKIIKIVTDNFS